MAFLRRFLKGSDVAHVKIYHKVYQDFHAIGNVVKEDPNLNIAKIKFIDVNGKEKNYWFHLFTGMVVTLPKKGEKYAKDVPFDSKKAYALSIEPVRLYELDPTADMNYVPKKTGSNEVDSESNPNTSVDKLH